MDRFEQAQGCAGVCAPHLPYEELDWEPPARDAYHPSGWLAGRDNNASPWGGTAHNDGLLQAPPHLQEGTPALRPRYRWRGEEGRQGDRSLLETTGTGDRRGDCRGEPASAYAPPVPALYATPARLYAPYIPHTSEDKESFRGGGALCRSETASAAWVFLLVLIVATVAAVAFRWGADSADRAWLRLAVAARSEQKEES